MTDKCAHTGPHGQCPHDAVEGSTFCASHADETERIRGYRLTTDEYRELYEEISKTDPLDSVRQELFLLRTLLTDRLNMAKSPAERQSVFNSGCKAVTDLVKCYEIMQKLERQNSIVLSKESVAQLTKDIIIILSEELQGVPNYEDRIDRIAERIGTAIVSIKNDE